MTNEEKKDFAKIYYVNHNYTQKEIASKLKTTEVTVSKWKTKGNWDILKAAQASRDDQIISMKYDQVNRILQAAHKEDRTVTLQEADLMAKLSKTVQQLNSKATLSHIIEVAEKMLLFYKEIDIEFAKKFAEQSMKFVEQEAKKYGK